MGQCVPITDINRGWEKDGSLRSEAENSPNHMEYENTENTINTESDLKTA